MKKRLVSLFLALTLALVSVPAYAQTDCRIEGAGSIDLSGGRAQHSVSVKSTKPSSTYALKGQSVLPSYYNAKDDGIPSGIKNQGATSTCWAFAHNEVLESYMAKYTSVRYDLSEENMKFETSNITNSKYGFARYPNSGGNEYISTAYLARGGAVLESAEPFTEGEFRYANAAAISSFGYLKDAPIFEFYKEYDATSNQLIKQLVTDYGAVGSGMYYEKYSGYEDVFKTNYYYSGSLTDYAGRELAPNHSVTIIGWDDNYSRFNFRNTPAGDGAFIVKNSWGAYHNNATDDIVYVSYYDPFISYQFFTSEYYAENELFDSVYQYDHFGYTANGAVESQSVVYATVYQADSINEAISAVSTYVTQSGMRLEVYVNPCLANITTGYTKVADETFDYTGYFTFDFEPVRITGTSFAVAIKVTAPLGFSETTFPLQTKVSGYVTNPTFAANTCYFGTDFGSLATIESRPAYANLSSMLCMKAFTVDVEPLPEPTPTPEPEPMPEIPLVDTGAMFWDVEYNTWYKWYVDYAVTHGLFSGKDGYFGTYDNITRAEFVQVLAKISGVDLSDKASYSGFYDVPSWEWYTAAVRWAGQYGIVAGKGDGIFDPHAPILREEMCVIFASYMRNYKGISIVPEVAPNTFADDWNIASWAKPSVYDCYSVGLIKGKDYNMFEPKATALRCEAATVFTNFYKKYFIS